MKNSSFKVNISGNRIAVSVDDKEILNLDNSKEDIYAFSINLTKEQTALIKKKFPEVSDKIYVFLDKVEMPYKYNWTNEPEYFDGAITFRLPFGKSAKLYVIITYGIRGSFGKNDRKRLLLLTRLLHGEKKLPELSKHGQSVVKGEPLGTDDYDKDSSLITLIKTRQQRYSPEEYKIIPPTLKEFVVMKSGKLMSQKDFIKQPRAQDRLVLQARLNEVEKFVKYALIRVFLDEKKIEV
jgi:hypothetical protein